MSTITKTIADTVREAFSFQVEKFRLYGPDGYNMRTQHFGLFRSDSMDCVGVAVKQGYEPHTTDDVVALAEAASEAFGGNAVARCNWNDGHHLSIVPSDDYRRSIFGTNDNVFPRLMIKAGYDGTAFRATLGFYRDACRNLSILNQVGGVSRRITHTSSLREKMDSLIEEFSTLAARWDGSNGVVETIRAMQAVETSVEDFMLRVYPVNADASAAAQTRAENRMRQLITRLMREKQETGRSITNTTASVWELYNAVTGYAQHDKTRRGNPNLFDRALLGINDTDSQKAEEVALALVA